MATIPVLIGNRVVQMLPAQAVEAMRSGAARMLPPGPTTVGSQAAGAQASGPFYGGFATNLPPALQRPGLIGRGAAGALGAGYMASGGGDAGSPERDQLFEELNRRGAAGDQQPVTVMDQIMSERRSPPSWAGTFNQMPTSTPTVSQPMLVGAPFPATGEGAATRTPVPRELFDVLSSYGAGAPAPSTPAPRELFDVLSSYGAGAPVSQQPIPVRPMDSTLFGEDVGPRPAPMRVMDSTLAGYDMPTTAPLPTRRPTAPGAPMQLASAAPSVRESFMQRLLSGPNYQSNSMPVVMSPQGPTPSGAAIPQQVNWGDAENAADFFRAEQAARQLGLLG